MWADNYWLICHKREILVHTVNNIIEELLNLDMAPQPESLWWTSSYEEEDQLTLKVGRGGKDWDLPFQGGLRGIGCRFQRDGRGTQGVEKTLRKKMGSWRRDADIYSSKSVSLRTKCQRVISHVVSTALHSSANWTWNFYNARTVHRWETKILRLTFRSKMEPGEEWVAYKARTARMLRIRWKKMGPVLFGQKCTLKKFGRRWLGPCTKVKSLF